MSAQTKKLAICSPISAAALRSMKIGRPVGAPAHLTLPDHSERRPKTHNGTLIKTIGDEICAPFPRLKLHCAPLAKCSWRSNQTIKTVNTPCIYARFHYGDVICEDGESTAMP